MGFIITSSFKPKTSGALEATGLYVTCHTHLSITKDSNPGYVSIKSVVHIYANLQDYVNGGAFYDKFEHVMTTNDLDTNLYTQYYNSLKATDRFSGATIVDDL